MTHAASAAFFVKGLVYVTQKRTTLIWSVFVVLIVAALMVVAAQTAPSAPAASGGAAEAPAPAAPADPNAEVFKLGDKVVTAAEFEPYFTIALRQLVAQQGMGANVDPSMLAQFGAMRPNFLDQYATQQVLLDQAEKDGLSATDQEVKAEVDQAKASAGENFQALLTQAGFTDEAQLESYIRDSLTIQKEVAKLQEGIKITDAQIKTSYDENKEQFAQPEQVCARHILVADKAKADDLYKQIQDGGDFAALAQANSTDPGSKENGGDLGCFGKGQMVPPFEEAAFATEVGGTSEPVQSDFGYHIIRVYEKNPATTTPLADVKDQIRQQLVSGRVGQEVQKLRDASGAEVFPENLPTTPPAIAPATPAAPAAPAPEGEGQ